MAPALRFKAKHWYFCFPLSTQIFMKNEIYNVIKIEYIIAIMIIVNLNSADFNNSAIFISA